MIKKLINLGMNEYKKREMFFRYLIVGGFSTVIHIGTYWLCVDIIGFTALATSLVYTPVWFGIRYGLNKKLVFKR